MAKQTKPQDAKPTAGSQPSAPGPQPAPPLTAEQALAGLYPPLPKTAANPPQKPPKRREVEKHRQCPLCYTGELNGVGTAYSTHAPTTYYRCDRCGHTWSVKSQHERTIIEHRIPRAGW